MNKLATWTAGGGIALAATAAGAAADRRLGTAPAATIVALGAAGAYLAGTFSPRSTLFGAPARAAAAEGAFALTFDDGPDPSATAEISSTLAAAGHTATFFVLGRAVRSHPHIAAAVLADGHELASHGDDHGLLAFATPREIERQIAAVERAVFEATGLPPVRLFRPPHGVRSPWLGHVVRQRGYRLCAWDGSVFDTAQPGEGAIAARVARLLRPGAVVLLHDGDGSGRQSSRRQTVAALPAILAEAKRHGLHSVRLSTLVA